MGPIATFASPAHCQVSHGGVAAALNRDAFLDMSSVDANTRELMESLRRQLMEEAANGGPHVLQSMLACVLRMSAQEREWCVELYHSQRAGTAGTTGMAPSKVPTITSRTSSNKPPCSTLPNLLGDKELTSPCTRGGFTPQLSGISEVPEMPVVDESITSMVRLARDGSPGARTHAAHVLGCLANASIENRAAIGQAGGVANLVQIARLGTAHARANAVAALASLVEGNAGNQAALVSSGGVAILVSLASECSACDKQHENVAKTFGVLAKNNLAFGRLIVESGGIAVLVRLVEGGSSASCNFAVFALRHLALRSAENQSAIARQGGVTALVCLVKDGSAEAQGYAAGALATLAENNDEIQIAIVAAGGIGLLVILLENGSADACRRAASALAHVAQHSPEHRAAIVAVGGVLPLLRLAREGSTEGTFALMCLARRSPEGQDAIIRLGGVVSLVHIVQHGSPAARGYAAGALSSLAEGGVCNCAVIARSGGIGHLQSLAREGTPKACHFAASALRQLMASAPEPHDKMMAAPCLGMVICA